MPSATSDEVVRLEVDAAPDPRLPGLICRVELGRPLQVHIDRPSILEREVLAAPRDELPHAA